MRLSPGLSLSLTDLSLAELSPGDLAPAEEDAFAAEAGGGWLHGAITVSGAASLLMPDGRFARLDPRTALLFHAASLSGHRIAQGQQPLRLVRYALHSDRLQALFGHAMPPILRGLLDPYTATRQIAMTRSSRRLRQLAAALFAADLQGPHRAVFMEGLLLQMLALQVEACHHEPQPAAEGALSPLQRQAVEAARERLLRDMRRPPSLSELAVAVGLTEKRLNAGFRSLYGVTVYELLRNERLERARVALDRGDASMKQVAFSVGYNHVTNFINAFAAQYGEPPGRFLRREQYAEAS